MKTPVLLLSLAVAVLGLVCLGGTAAAQEESREGPPAVLDAEGVAWIDANNGAIERIQKAERQRAKLLFMEENEKGTVLAFAIPQPTTEEIEAFMTPLKEFIATTQSDRYRGIAKEAIVNLKRGYGLEKGEIRAVYLLIPADKEEPLNRVSFAAESEAECEKFIREDLKPVKLEIGKPYTARSGSRGSFFSIEHGWKGEELVKDRGLEGQLESWVDWHRKRGMLKK